MSYTELSNEAKKFLCFSQNQENETSSSQDDCFLLSIFPLIPNLEIYPVLPLDEEDYLMSQELNINEYFNNPSENSIFESLFENETQKKVSLFSSLKKDEHIKEEVFCQRKRYPLRRRRKENNDNMRRKIKRTFLNSALIPKINMMIKNKGGQFFFKKFNQHFVDDVSKKTNRELLNMTLEEIFRKKELYQENELPNYKHNINFVENQIIRENEDLKKILNLKYFELFEEYINSKEFLIDVNRLKKKNNDDLYIQRYINLAKHFIKFIRE